MKDSPRYVEMFVTGYMAAELWTALDWSEVDDETVHNPEPLDRKYSLDDFTDETLTGMRADCLAFIDANDSDLDAALDVIDADRCGHDFSLTRNGHGSGFWDEYYGDNLATRNAFTRLADAARVYGETNYFPADDGKVVAG